MARKPGKPAVPKECGRKVKVGIGRSGPVAPRCELIRELTRGVLAEAATR